MSLPPLALLVSTTPQVDPLDRRRLVLCGAKGSFIVLW